MKNMILRGLSVVIGVVLIALYAACGAWSVQLAELNNGGDQVQLNSGAVLEIPLKSAFERTDRVSVRLGDVSQAGEMTLALALWQDGREVAAEEFALAGKRSQAALQLEPAEGIIGQVTLRITASDEGCVTLVGEGDMPYIRHMGSRRTRNLSMLYLGVTMVLLALVPAGRREAAHHA